MGCAGISEHGPHLLREGHMGERRWETSASVLFDACGRCWEAEGGRQGVVEVEEVELQHSTSSQRIM